ncbi:enoyl-CoA hydratase/isomerase family protein [Streptomyces sp. NBC_00459]|uniref:enoyl-CoA hydratase/isomerase family protein n=1 Tax=Streptomyces sp. NBC_00459 TaxID=2975749 RepID=UPI002E188858
MSGGEPVLLRTDRDGVRTLTLNRPHRKNALDAELWAALRDALTAAGRDHDVRALVVTGAGGAFCSGADISGGLGSVHPLYRMRTLSDIALQLHELPVPTIAKVTGVAVGAGWNLALGCDLVVATPEARFSQIFARRGLSLDLGGSWLLPKLVGLQQAKRLALLAETIGAEEARSLGLVTWVVAAGEVDSFVDGLGARLVAGAPVALAQTKALLNEGADRTLRDALANEARAQGVNFATADVSEAFTAFMAKREPTFDGRWAVPATDQQTAEETAMETTGSAAPGARSVRRP